MKISDTSLNSLRIALLEALPSAILLSDGDVFINDFNKKVSIETIFSEQEQELLEKHLDDGGLLYCIQRFISDELFSSGFKGSGRSTIGDQFGHDGMLSLTKRIADHIQSLPKSYVIISEVSPQISSAMNCNNLKVKLSDRISIISEDQLPQSIFGPKLTFLSYDEIHGFPGDQQLPLSMSARHVAGDGDQPSYTPLYIEYKCSGLITDDSNSKIFREFYDELRAFYGIMRAAGLLGSITYREPHKLQNSSYALVDRSDSAIIASVESNPKDIIDASKFLVSTSVKEWINSLTDKSEFFTPALRIFSTNDHRLRTASVWMLRAIQSTRPLDQLLEAAIVVEVLLGDRATSDRIGLSKLMANRCAYALGKTVSEREKVIKDFEHFYQIRSLIVHTGRFQVSKKDKEAISNGLGLATRILRHELDLLKPGK